MAFRWFRVRRHLFVGLLMRPISFQFGDPLIGLPVVSWTFIFTSPSQLLLVSLTCCAPPSSGFRSPRPQSRERNELRPAHRGS
eukprot:2729824-Prymnesium_polylepis.1